MHTLYYCLFKLQYLKPRITQVTTLKSVLNMLFESFEVYQSTIEPDFELAIKTSHSPRTATSDSVRQWFLTELANSSLIPLSPAGFN